MDSQDTLESWEDEGGSIKPQPSWRVRRTLHVDARASQADPDGLGEGRSDRPGLRAPSGVVEVVISEVRHAARSNDFGEFVLSGS
jgi:hypothetical protein